VAEALLHPLCASRAGGAGRRSGGALGVEVPLLFEKGLENWFDSTVCVPHRLPCNCHGCRRVESLPTSPPHGTPSSFRSPGNRRSRLRSAQRRVHRFLREQVASLAVAGISQHLRPT
jgi:hypothetical protein